MNRTSFALLGGMILARVVTGCASETDAPRLTTCEDQAITTRPPYTRSCNADGVRFESTDATALVAREKASTILRQMSAARPQLLRALARAQTRVIVMGETENTTDMPEWAELASTPELREYWNERARGLGATRERPVALVPEEDAACYRTRERSVGSVTIHELAHTLHLVAMPELDVGFSGRVKEVYDSAMKVGLWKDTYATTNELEYFAVGVTAWFDAGCSTTPANGVCNEVGTRTALSAYDPSLAALVREMVGDAPPIGLCVQDDHGYATPRACTTEGADITLHYDRGPATVRGTLTFPDLPPSGSKLFLIPYQLGTDATVTSYPIVALDVPSSKVVRYEVTGLEVADYAMIANLADASGVEVWRGQFGGAFRQDLDGFLFPTHANMFHLDATPRCGVDVPLTAR